MFGTEGLWPKRPQDLTCVVVVVDGHCGRVVFAQQRFRRVVGLQGGGANLGVANHSRVAEVDVEVLVLFKDVIVNHSDCDLCGSEGGGGVTVAQFFHFLGHLAAICTTFFFSLSFVKHT